MKNNDVLDALSEAIEKTILNFIDTDVYYFIAPYLSRKEISLDCPFFKDNRVSIQSEVGFPDTLTDKQISDNLKTISWLSLFQRNRVAYNPKNIDYYLRTLGYIKYNESAMDILCFEDGECGNENKNITYEEWLSIS